MAGLDAYLAKALLDWALGGATVTQPVGRFIGGASGSPTSVSGSAAPGYRATVSFQTASTGPSASASLKAAATFTHTAACTIYGWNLYDNTSAGNRLMYGTITLSQSQASGDAIAFTAANLKITLA